MCAKFQEKLFKSMGVEFHQSFQLFKQNIRFLETNRALSSVSYAILFLFRIIKLQKNQSTENNFKKCHLSEKIDNRETNILIKKTSPLIFKLSSNFQRKLVNNSLLCCKIFPFKFKHVKFIHFQTCETENYWDMLRHEGTKERDDSESARTIELERNLDKLK